MTFSNVSFKEQVTPKENCFVRVGKKAIWVGCFQPMWPRLGVDNKNLWGTDSTSRFAFNSFVKFLLNFFFPFLKGALSGLLTGITLSFWVAIGAFLYPAPASKTWPLPLSTDHCVLSNVTESVPTVLPSRYVELEDSVRSQGVGNRVRGRCILQGYVQQARSCFPVRIPPGSAQPWRVLCRAVECSADIHYPACRGSQEWTQQKR